MDHANAQTVIMIIIKIVYANNVLNFGIFIKNYLFFI